VLTALISGVVAILAIFTTIAAFMLTLSEPALRIPLMALTTFGATFLSRAATPGPVLFSAGFIIVYGLTMGDDVLALALQPATNGNAPKFAVPEIAFIPPAEALVHTLLWLTLSVSLPIALLIAANLVTGRDPTRVLRAALAERLDAAARFCTGEQGAERRLEGQAFEGTAALHKLHHLAGVLGPRRHSLWGASLITDIGRLGLLLLAWLRVEGGDRGPLLPAAGACRSAERALRTGEAQLIEPAAIVATGAARPVADGISVALQAIRETLAAPPATAPGKQGAAAPRRLLAADAFATPNTFALPSKSRWR
jgi:multidrug resistance protein MdtO